MEEEKNHFIRVKFIRVSCVMSDDSCVCILTNYILFSFINNTYICNIANGTLAHQCFEEHYLSIRKVDIVLEIEIGWLEQAEICLNNI